MTLWIQLVEGSVTSTLDLWLQPPFALVKIIMDKVLMFWTIFFITIF